MFVTNSVGVAEHHELRSLDLLTFCVGSCILSKCFDRLIEIVWLVEERLAAVAVVVAKWSSAKMGLQQLFHILWHCFAVVPINSSDLWWHRVWQSGNIAEHKCLCSAVWSSKIGQLGCDVVSYSENCHSGTGSFLNVCTVYYGCSTWSVRISDLCSAICDWSIVGSGTIVFPWALFGGMMIVWDCLRNWCRVVCCCRQ